MYKYFAFISYSSKDYKRAKYLQNRLEYYKMPSILCTEKGWDRHPMRPIFFAPTDIQPGNLSEELKKRLRDSRYLIVVCSPDSAKSDWVAREVRYFHEIGRGDDIYLYIVEGVPHSGNPMTECFNPVFDELSIPEILAVNIREKISVWPFLNRERAIIQLITKLLGVEFDLLWNRHRRQSRLIIATVLVFIVLLISSFVILRYVSLPVDVEIHIQDKTPKVDALPQTQEIYVTLYVDNEEKLDTISSFHHPSIFNNVQHKALGKPVNLSVVSPYYMPLDTSFVLRKENFVGVRRNNDYYGAVRFKLWHPNKDVSHIKVYVEGFEAISDSNGFVAVDIPLEKQKEIYNINAEIPLVDTLFIMPSGSRRVIEIK